MRFYDLFGGIGGFRLGLEKAMHRGFVQEQNRQGSAGLFANGNDNRNGWNNANFKRKPTINSKFECIGYCDWNKFAVQCYNENFKESHEPTDATKINPAKLPDFDLLCAGFPCQSFSVAGKRKGFQDIRGTLFYEIVRIAKEKKPRLLLLENVKGLLSNDSGKSFYAVLVSLAELGYRLEWEVLNSKDFGVPQNRERVFIAGHLGGESEQQVFPLGKGIEVLNGENETAQGGGERVCSTIHSGYANLQGQGETYVQERIEVSAIQLSNPNMRGRREKNVGEECFCVDTGATGGIKLDNTVRRLTPVECERLQGFPDGWTGMLSDTQRYKTLGNSVTVNVVQAIGEKLLNNK